MGSDQLEHEKVPVKSPSPPNMERVSEVDKKLEADAKKRPVKKFTNDKPVSCFRSGGTRPFTIGAMQKNGFDMMMKNGITDMKKYLLERRKQLAAQKRAKSLDASVMDIQNGEYLTGEEVIAENEKNLQHLKDVYNSTVSSEGERQGAVKPKEPIVTKTVLDDGEIVEEILEEVPSEDLAGQTAKRKTKKRTLPNGEVIEDIVQTVTSGDAPQERRMRRRVLADGSTVEDEILIEKCEDGRRQRRVRKRTMPNGETIEDEIQTELTDEGPKTRRIRKRTLATGEVIVDTIEIVKAEDGSTKHMVTRTTTSAAGEVTEEVIEGAEALNISKDLAQQIAEIEVESSEEQPAGLEKIAEELDFDSEGEPIPEDEDEDQRKERFSRRKPKTIIRPPLNSKEVQEIRQRAAQQSVSQIANKAFKDFRPKSPEHNLESKTEEMRARVAHLEAETRRIENRAHRLREKNEQIESLRFPGELQEAVSGLTEFRPAKKMNKATRSMSMVFH